MFRFSLRSLIGVVSVAAISCAALMNATGWIASTAWTIAVLVLLLSTVTAVLCATERRGFWAGFAIVGWSYLLLAIGPMDEGFKGKLWTTVLLQKAGSMSSKSFVNVEQQILKTTTMPYPASSTSGYANSPPPPPQPLPSTIAYYYASGQYAQVKLVDDTFLETFQQIGQALSTLLFAFIGGMFGACVMARNKRPVQTGLSG